MTYYHDHLTWVCSELQQTPEELGKESIRELAQMKHADMSGWDSANAFGEAIGADNEQHEELMSMVLGWMSGNDNTPENMQKIGEQVCTMAAEYLRPTIQNDYNEVER